VRKALERVALKVEKVQLFRGGDSNNAWAIDDDGTAAQCQALPVGMAGSFDAYSAWN